MKTYKWFFVALTVVVLAACKGDSEDAFVGNWTKVGDFGGAPRAYASSFIIGKNAYIVGGYNGYNERRRDLWIYELGEGWRNTTDSLPKGYERQQAVAFSINGKGYVGTGWKVDINSISRDEVIFNDFWEYDPAKSGQRITDEYGNRSAAWRKVKSLPAAARYNAIAFTLGNVAYVGTGYTAGADKETLQDFWKFTPPSNDTDLGSWERVSGYGGSKRSGAVSFVINNIAYICTGTNTSTGTSLGGISDFWSFDGTTWKELRRITNYNQDEDYDDSYTSIVRSGGVAFTMNGKGYVTIGTTGATWEYEPSTDLWTQRTSFVNNSMVISRDGGIALSFPQSITNTKDMVMVGTGRTSAQAYYDDMRQFSPEDEDNTYDD